MNCYQWTTPSRTSQFKVVIFYGKTQYKVWDSLLLKSFSCKKAEITTTRAMHLFTTTPVTMISKTILTCFKKPPFITMSWEAYAGTSLPLIKLEQSSLSWCIARPGLLQPRVCLLTEEEAQEKGQTGSTEEHRAKQLGKLIEDNHCILYQHKELWLGQQTSPS